MRRLKFIPMAVIFILLTANLTFAGVIKGVVTVKGIRSPEDIAIFIDKVLENKFEPPKEAASLDQKNLVFVPHVMPILVGTKVNFPNNDSVKHNVFSPSKIKKFNLGTYGVGQSKSIVFDKPGKVALLCNVHAEMSAYALVLKNPYFAVTDKEGKFSIPNDKAMKAAKVSEEYKELPAGKYIIKTWHQKLKTVSQEVTVPEEGEVEVQLS